MQKGVPPAWRAFIRAHLGAEVGERCEVLNAGLSNQNLLLDNRYVLRVNRECAGLGSGRMQEVSAWQNAAQASLAPRLLAVAAQQRAYLSEYIDQPTPDWPARWASEVSAARIRDAMALPVGSDCATRTMRPLLDLLQGLAGLPIPEKQVSLTQQWQAYRKALSTSATMKAECQQLLALSARVEMWLRELSATTDAVQFCHRDLNPYNLLWHGGQLVCIDFEYACASHPLLDLATVLATHAFSPAQLRWLVSHYLNWHPQLGMNAVSALPAAVNLYWVFACCWALLQGEERRAEYQQYYALLDLN